MSDAPERVWLLAEFAAKHVAEKQARYFPNDTGYVRLDLHDAVIAERDALKAALERSEALRREDALQHLADMGQMADRIDALGDTGDDT